MINKNKNIVKYIYIILLILKKKVIMIFSKDNILSLLKEYMKNIKYFFSIMYQKNNNYNE